MPESENSTFSRILNQSRHYYENRLAEFGDTPRGVDWNGEQSQSLRFEMLTDIAPLAGHSVHDVGCGVGHLADFIKSRCGDVAYSGSDISSDMVEAARKRHPDCRFEAGSLLDDPLPAWAMADYVMASGVFYVRQDSGETEWQHFVWAMIDRMAEAARLGIAFNLITSHVDYRDDHLSYWDPGAVLNELIRRFGRRVRIRHDYGLYEFTAYVFKDG